MMTTVSFRPISVASRLALPSAAASARWTSSSSLPSRGGGGGGSNNDGPKRLILYSKQGCCLCDGLKEKLHAALSLSGPHSLASVRLQVRDITENPEWERRYQYEIPVLARILPDGTEETLPRLSPRMGAEFIQKKIATALEL